MSATAMCAAPAMRAAITHMQPIVPPPVTSTRLPSSEPARRTACRPIDSGSAQAISPSEMSDSVTARELALAHHEVLTEQALCVREHAGAAEEEHAPAQVQAPAAAVVALAAGVRGIDGDAVTRLHARDLGADRLDHARGLVPRHQRLADHEGADAAVLPVVQVGAADAAGAQAQPHVVRAERRGRPATPAAGRVRHAA